MPILKSWLDEAFSAGAQPNPHAVALATVDPDGSPSVRMVLCNAIEPEAGDLVFYSNRESRKGLALAWHPRAALVFYWGPQSRQARVEGPVRLISDADSDAYFATRPLDAQVGAWASDQSQPIATRSELERKVELAARKVARMPQPLRPPYWGGYALRADKVELWVSRPARIHDRALWTRSLDTSAAPWTVVRLQP
jgi:pyridoxamine 5'-phosphate oxidase